MPDRVRHDGDGRCWIKSGMTRKGRLLAVIAGKDPQSQLARPAISDISADKCQADRLHPFLTISQNRLPLRNRGRIFASGHVLRPFSCPGQRKSCFRLRFNSVFVPGTPEWMYDDDGGSPDGWRKVSASEPRKVRKPGTLSDIPADGCQAELPIPAHTFAVQCKSLAIKN